MASAGVARQRPLSAPKSASEATAKAACPSAETSPQATEGKRAADAARPSSPSATTPTARLIAAAKRRSIAPSSALSMPSGTSSEARGTASRLASGAISGKAPKVEATSEAVAHCAPMLIESEAKSASPTRRLQWRGRGSRPAPGAPSARAAPRRAAAAPARSAAATGPAASRMPITER